MPVKIDLLDDNLLQGLDEFSDSVWDFPASSAFRRWRIADPPGSRFYVAHDEGRWLAAIGGQHKTYLNCGEPVDCLETYAWASRKVKEAKGWGIKTMKALMEEGKPLVALGGSPDTLEYMPRLGFAIMAQAPSMALPLRAEFAKDMPGVRGILAKSAIVGSTLLANPFARRDRSLRMQPLAVFDERTLAMPCLPGFQASFEPELFRWQIGWAEQGSFLALRYVRDRQIVGWLYLRLAEESRGQIVSRLLECKFAAGSVRRDHIAMIRMMIATSAGFGATVIRTLTTCPDTNAALNACHFRSRSESPAMIYHNGIVSQDQPFRVSVLRADGGAQPLPQDALAL